MRQGRLCLGRRKRWLQWWRSAQSVSETIESAIFQKLWWQSIRNFHRGFHKISRKKAGWRVVMPEAPSSVPCTRKTVPVLLWRVLCQSTYQHISIETASSGQKGWWRRFRQRAVETAWWWICLTFWYGTCTLVARMRYSACKGTTKQAQHKKKTKVFPFRRFEL